MRSLMDLIIKSFVLAIFVIAFITSSDLSKDKVIDTFKSVTNFHQQPIQELAKEQVEIVRVVDGDTVVVKFNDGTTEKVRMLLVDTPESVHSTKGAQPFGKEASDYTKKMLAEGKKVTLEIGNPERDKYNRLLGYIWVDGMNFNKKLIEEGYARVAYVEPPNTKYLDEFYEAQEQAKSQKLRIWSIPGYVTDNGYNTSAAR